MATTKKSSSGSGSAKGSRRPGAASLDRLNESLDAAQKALGEIQGDLGRGGRDIVKNVSRLLKDARRDTAKLNRALVKDIGQLGRALTPGTNSGTARKSPTKRTATKRTAAKRTTAKRTTAAKS
jgi:hypothetical protein